MTRTTLALACAVGIATACGPSRDTDKEKVETEKENAATGRTVKSKTEVERESGGRTLEMSAETYVGIVTEYAYGRSLAMRTDDGKAQEFDLGQEGVIVTVEPSVRVGSKVEVIVDKREGRTRRISVVPHA